MKNIIYTIIPLFVFLFSCTSYNEGKNLNIKNAELAHSKFIIINSDYSYKEYKSLMIEYGKNSKFPEIK